MQVREEVLFAQNPTFLFSAQARSPSVLSWRSDRRHQRSERNGWFDI